MSLNDDRSPLLDMMNCIVCDQPMKLEKIDPDDGATTSLNIGANCAAALSDCVCFAEVANKADPRRTIAPSYFETTPYPFKNEKLRRYHTEKLAAGTKPRKCVPSDCCRDLGRDLYSQGVARIDTVSAPSDTVHYQRSMTIGQHLPFAAVTSISTMGSQQGDCEQHPVFLDIGKRDQADHQSRNDIAQGIGMNTSVALRITTTAPTSRLVAWSGVCQRG